MKKKGFTLIELLVVIAIIAMLLAILMPALNKVKKIAQRVVCGTNLKGLGTAQTVYANDYSDAYAVQGKTGNHTFADQTGTGAGPGANTWQDKAKDWSIASNITIGASLYLLVREADVSPKSFICPSGDQKEFSGKNTGGTSNAALDITDLWDFGQKDLNNEGPAKTVSYSYHMPYVGGSGAGSGKRGSYAASGSNTAAFALMADKSPWCDAKLTKNTSPTADNYMNAVYLLGTGATGTITDWSNISPKWCVQIANAYSHSREGQNVLFGDGHSEYTTRSDVGVTSDNIYTSFTQTNPTTEAMRRQGIAMSSAPNTTTGSSMIHTASSGTTGSITAKGSDDAVLVND